MPCMHELSSSPSATACESGASNVVNSQNEDILVSDMIRYIIQDIFDKIHKKARFR